MASIMAYCTVYGPELASELDLVSVKLNTRAIRHDDAGPRAGHWPHCQDRAVAVMESALPGRRSIN
jgi:hypothetical protein